MSSSFACELLHKSQKSSTSASTTLTRTHTATAHTYRAHTRAHNCVAAQLKSSMATALERAHTQTHTHSYTWLSWRLSCLPCLPLPLLNPPTACYPLAVVYHAKVLIFAQRTSHRIALHRIACPFFVLRLTFACRLTGYGYGYAFERFKFHIATALASPPACPFPPIWTLSTHS